MPEDSDANVMKIVIDEEGCILLILGQSMAEVTTGLGIEQFPTAFGRVADGVCLSCDEMIEGRIERSQRPFVRCNGAQHIPLVHGPAERLHEMPTDTGRPSVNARAGSWQVAQATDPSPESRGSKNSF